MTERRKTKGFLQGEPEKQAALVLETITQAGPAGITRMGIHEATGLGHHVVKRHVEALAGTIYIAAWPRQGTNRFPAYAIGNLPDMPRPPSERDRSKADDNAEEALHADQEFEHARWTQTWAPRPDAAAAWMGGRGA